MHHHHPSIYYYIWLYPRRIDHNPMNHYWKNLDGVVIVGCEVDINSVHQKQQQQQPPTIYHTSTIISARNDGNINDDDGTK